MKSLLDQPIILLARPSKALSPDDSAARAAGMFRASGVSSLPVVDGGRVVGVATEASVLSLLASNMREDPSEELASRVRISSALREQVAFAHKDMNVGQVVEVFDSCNDSVLPVVDDYGGFYGMVTRTEILAYLSGSLRPSNVAGMATPLGVYLTNGSVRAGAGDLGLLLSGITLGLNMVAAWIIIYAVAFGLQKLTGVPFPSLLSGSPYLSPKWLSLISWMPPALAVVLMMGLIRLSPLSGYHAAEHMTVHAMEAGEELTPESVERMPRVHPRCGTNFLAAALVFIIIAESSTSEVAMLMAMVAVIIGWRTVGGFMQQIATTKTPSRKQLENGVRVGNELIARYREQPSYQAYGLARIWNSGLLQSMGGLALTSGFAELASNLLRHKFGIILPF